MSFPSSTGTRQDSLASAWELSRNIASSVKNRANSLKTSAAAGSIGSSSILDFATYLADAKVSLTRVSQVGGIAAYAQAQINDSTINIATEFSGMMSAIDSVTAWIIANFPKDGSGFLLARSFSGDNSGRTTDRQFTSVQTAGLRTALDGLIAAID